MFTDCLFITLSQKFSGHNDPDTFFTDAQRNMMAWYIINRTPYGQHAHQVGISHMINIGAYHAAYPLHDGSYQNRGKAVDNG